MKTIVTWSVTFVLTLLLAPLLFGFLTPAAGANVILTYWTFAFIGIPVFIISSTIVYFVYLLFVPN